jgi:hypothetical protein
MMGRVKAEETMSEIERYLSQVQARLWLDKAGEAEIVDELRSHLEETALEWQISGLSRQESEARAVYGLGDANELAQMMREAHGDSVNEAILAAFLPVALTLSFKWVILPACQALGHWQHHVTPVVIGSLAILALLVPGLTAGRWRYGYAAWAFFSLIAIAQI